MVSRSEIVGEIRAMLRGVWTARDQGGSRAKLAEAQGNVDGYMRALVDTGVLSRDELLSLVVDERSAKYGPATADVSADRFRPGHAVA